MSRVSAEETVQWDEQDAAQTFKEYKQSHWATICRKIVLLPEGHSEQEIQVYVIWLSAANPALAMVLCEVREKNNV